MNDQAMLDKILRLLLSADAIGILAEEGIVVVHRILIDKGAYTDMDILVLLLFRTVD